jgi:hypothetical protein
MNENERVVTQQGLEQLLREAEHAHAEYERRLGHADDGWPAWYAAYIYDKLPPAPST